uniref:Uncharacterized protein n=1 Tax=Lygus hesperus TaxID=30085 RepID=A0A146KYI7_LYGHE
MLSVGPATNEDYYVTRPDARSKKGTVRVMFTIFSTKVDEMLCYSVASAYLSNIPIVVLGYNTKHFTFLSKHTSIMPVIDREKLADEDVLLKLDVDILFSGLDYMPFIDKFIKLSPASLQEMDARAVRSGDAIAPIVFTTEKYC